MDWSQSTIVCSIDIRTILNEKSSDISMTLMIDRLNNILEKRSDYIYVITFESGYMQSSWIAVVSSVNIETIFKMGFYQTYIT